MNEELNVDRANYAREPGQKSPPGGPYEETMISVLHALNTFANQIVHLLKVKAFKCVLVGNQNNDSI